MAALALAAWHRDERLSARQQLIGQWAVGATTAAAVAIRFNGITTLLAVLVLSVDRGVRWRFQSRRITALVLPTVAVIGAIQLHNLWKGHDQWRGTGCPWTISMSWSAPSERG